MKGKINVFVILIVLFFSVDILCAQELIIEADATVTSFVSGDEPLPFWLHANTTSKIDSETDLAADAGIKANYKFKNNHTIDIGARFQYNNGLDTDVNRNELYAKYTTPIFSITAGAKAEDELQYGLSTSNKNFQLSRNARPFPGVLLKTEKSISLFDKFSLDAEFAHYELNDTRFVEGAKVHYKMLQVNYEVIKHHRFSFAVRHYAMWGGTNPLTGPQPDQFSDLVRIFFGRAGGDNAGAGDQVNALGNHLGSFNFAYDFLTEAGAFSLYHNHPFEDGSGTAFKNFPDGIWGIFLTPDDVWAVKGILYEYVDTSDQSGASGRSGRDNYFNNLGYRSGWTYDGNTIGIPFITVPGNTRVIAHHFGVFLKIKRIDITGKATYIENKGTFFTPIDPIQKGYYTSLHTTYNTKNYGSISLLAGFDAISSVTNTYAFGLQYSYQIK